MKRIAGALLILLLLVESSALATQSKPDDKKPAKDTQQKLYEKKGDKERIYNVDMETMWRASMKAAAEENVIEHHDKELGIITFKTGMSMASWGFKVSINLTKIDDTHTRIKLTTQKTRGQLFAWGAGGRTVEKYFKGLDKQIEQLQANKPTQ